MKVRNNELLRDLQKEEERLSSEAELLQEAEELIRKGEKEDERILERIRQARPKEGAPIEVGEEDAEQVFSERAIRSLCIKYRLRFLSTRLFKGDLPYEAVQAVKNFEKRVGEQIEDLRIIAPSERFQLQDSQKDPLLFAYLGKGRFYLLHSWGKELSPWRKMLHFPFRNLGTLIASCALLSFLISLLLPAHFFHAGEGATTQELIVLFRALSFFLLSSFFLTATLVYGVTTSKEFSADQWNSKFFN